MDRARVPALPFGLARSRLSPMLAAWPEALVARWRCTLGADSRRSEIEPGETEQHTLPVSPQNGPYAVEVVEGQRYRWCSCGLSATQPWCDDSHAGTGMEPIEFVAPITAVFYMCGCKRSHNAPYCFGTCRGHTRPGF